MLKFIFLQSTFCGKTCWIFLLYLAAKALIIGPCLHMGQRVKIIWNRYFSPFFTRWIQVFSHPSSSPRGLRDSRSLFCPRIPWKWPWGSWPLCSCRTAGGSSAKKVIWRTALQRSQPDPKDPRRPRIGPEKRDIERSEASRLSVQSWGYPQSSWGILDWDFPWNQPTSYWGSPVMEAPWWSLISDVFLKWPRCESGDGKFDAFNLHCCRVNRQ